MQITLIDLDACLPGGVADVWMQPLWIDLLRSRVAVGDRLELCEARRIIGVASILEVFDTAPDKPVPTLDELQQLYPLN